MWWDEVLRWLRCVYVVRVSSGVVVCVQVNAGR